MEKKHQSNPELKVQNGLRPIANREAAARMFEAILRAAESARKRREAIAKEIENARQKDVRGPRL